MAVSGPVTMKEIRPDVGPSRMNSMDNNVKALEAQVLPNYLRASIGTCHDICKFGRRRDLTMETTLPGKLPGSPHKGREPDKSNNLKKRNSLFCTSRSPSTVRNPPCKVKAKEIQPGANKVVANAKNPEKLKLKPSEKKRALSGGWKYETNASKTPRGTKKSISVPKIGSLSPKPEVTKVLKKASCSKNKDSKADIERANFEDIPEKILYITELNSENQAVMFNPEEIISDDSLQCKKHDSLVQKSQDESYIDKEIDLVQFSAHSPSSKESNDSQTHEWDDNTKNLRIRDVYCKEDEDENENEMNNVVLRHQNEEQKRSPEGLFNDVIEETVRELAKTRKGKVKALVNAFETVISLQDLCLLEKLKCGDIPNFPLCVD